MDTIRGAGASRGGDEFHNEDSYLVRDGLGLYVVCDGLGSEPGGEVASYVAVEAIVHALEDSDELGALAEGAISEETVERAIRYALGCLIDAKASRPDLAGMASTITMLLVQKGRGYIGHIGDSRAYLVRDRRCVQLTADQEWTEQARATGDRGEEGDGDSNPRIQSFSVSLSEADTFILCTDGAEQEVEALEDLASIEDLSPRLLASRIVGGAHRKNPESDATVVVVRILEDRHPAWLEVSSPPNRYEEAHTVVPRSARFERTRRRSDSVWAVAADQTRSDRRSRSGRALARD